MKTIRNFLLINIVVASLAIFDAIAMQLPEDPIWIGAQGYGTLHEAVQAAPNNATTTIQIRQNMTIDQEIAIVGKAIIIKPVGDVTLLRGYDYDGHLFKVEQGAFLTLETNIQNEQNRLVIDGDGKSHFIIDQDNQQVYFDPNAPRQINGRQEHYRDYERNVDVPIEETGQQYVMCDDGRRLYIDGTKRKIIIEKSQEKVYIQERVYIDETDRGKSKQFIIGENAQRIFINTENDKYHTDNSSRKIVTERVVIRQVKGCVVANYGTFIIGGDVTLCNNCNVIMDGNFDWVYDQNSPYGVVYNKGAFYMLGGYIKNNEGNGVFNAECAVFNMNDGKIFGNSAAHGAGVLNFGTFNLHGGKISKNRACFDGGGVYNSRTMIMLGGIISENEIDFNYYNAFWHQVGYGGGICNNENGILTIKDGTIEKNCAKDGGGIYNKGTLKMTGGGRIVKLCSWCILL